MTTSAKEMLVNPFAAPVELDALIGHTLTLVQDFHDGTVQVADGLNYYRIALKFLSAKIR